MPAPQVSRGFAEVVGVAVARTVISIQVKVRGDVKISSSWFGKGVFLIRVQI